MAILIHYTRVPLGTKVNDKRVVKCESCGRKAIKSRFIGSAAAKYSQKYVHQREFTERPGFTEVLSTDECWIRTDGTTFHLVSGIFKNTGASA